MNVSRRGFCSTLAAPPLATLAARPSRPNIVLILADDLGYGDLACYNGQSKIPTPNIDRLASQGVRFTDMHSPSSVCTPTRYGILTGRYCWRGSLKRGVLQGYSPDLIEEGRQTLPSLLKANGYYTAGVGKWHLGLGRAAVTNFDAPLNPGPRQHGFDYYLGIPASLDMPPYLYFENERVVEKATAHTNGNGGGNTWGPFWREGAIAPGFKIDQVMPELTRKAVEVVRGRARAGAQPFFLYFPMTGPHTPWMPVPPYQGRSGAGSYGDFVTQIDDAAGQVIRAVDEAGLGSSTLVIFASDNGGFWRPEDIRSTGHRSNHTWRGMKADIYEAGHRIPFLARWTGRIGAGGVVPDLGCLTDIFATAAEAAGLRLPDSAAEDSFSHFAAMRSGGRGKPARDSVIHHSSQGMFAIREARWKLIQGRGSGGFTRPVAVTPGPGDPAGELYDLSADPSETANRYASEPAVVSRLTVALEKAKTARRSRPA